MYQNYGVASTTVPSYGASSYGGTYAGGAYGANSYGSTSTYGTAQYGGMSSAPARMQPTGSSTIRIPLSQLPRRAAEASSRRLGSPRALRQTISNRGMAVMAPTGSVQYGSYGSSNGFQQQQQMQMQQVQHLQNQMKRVSYPTHRQIREPPKQIAMPSSTAYHTDSLDQALSALGYGASVPNPSPAPVAMQTTRGVYGTGGRAPAYQQPSYGGTYGSSQQYPVANGGIVNAAANRALGGTGTYLAQRGAISTQYVLP